MSSLNKATLIGNVGKDPDIRTMQSGDKVANLTLATSEKWKDKNTGEQRESTQWHNVVIWGSLADVVERFVKKGFKLYIEGKIETRKWQDQNGNDKYTTEIVLRGYGGNLVMLDSKPMSNGYGDLKDDISSMESVHGGGDDDMEDEIPW